MKGVSCFLLIFIDFIMANILEALVYASERAANVARSCCTGHGAEGLLVAEKSEGEANTRFERDFKTIADVLAQEAARGEVGKRCPALAEHFRGEECAEISGVAIKLRDNVEQTSALLSELVPPASARRMAKAAHDDFTLSIKLPEDIPHLNPSDLGVWIDPIDGTSEFIEGVQGSARADCGLPCVTVLIGAYLRSTGEPVVGVINQPFYDQGKGRIIWGLCYGDTKLWSGGSSQGKPSDNRIALVSAVESPDLVDKFKQAGWDAVALPGAGNKLMNVVLGSAALYIVSGGTTYRWDTCGPHAILRARGGDILCYTSFKPLTYSEPPPAPAAACCCNAGGIIAYAQTNVLSQINSILD